jgi:hypothetical protein
MASQPAFCDSCQAPLIFARTQGGKQMPLNKQPDETGNVAAYQDHLGTWHARVLRKHQEPDAHEKRYLPHFATCSDPAAHRRRQRGNWKSAQADAAAKGRRRRGAPNPQQPYLGYRTTP